MEALVCGIPVVAMRVGGIPELITNERLGILVEPEKPKALAVRISSGLERSWNREYLHQHAQQFTWENIALQIYQVYLEMTKGID